MKKTGITVLKSVLFFIGWAVLAGIIEIPSDDPAVWRFFAELIPLAILLLLTVIFLLIEKKKVKIPVTENLGKGMAVGTLAGVLWIGLAAGILLISGQLSVVGKTEIPRLWLWIVSAFLNVVMQELLVRGYLYQLLKKNFNLPAAVTVTTALFTFMHAGAFEAGILPVINVITMCLFTTALYESERTLAAPVMAHAVWNIAGALFLGGVRLAEDYPHLLTLSASENTLLSGGEYMIEAGIVVTVLNIALTLLFCLKRKKQTLHGV